MKRAVVWENVSAAPRWWNTKEPLTARPDCAGRGLAMKATQGPPVPHLPGEEWRPLPGWEGKYLISSLGRVYSFRRRGAPGGLKVLTPGNRGYLQLGLGDLRRVFHVHVLVCAAFYGPRPEWAAEIRHLDGNRLNNTVSNLRYGTRSENAQDTVAHGSHNWMGSETHCLRGHEFTEGDFYVTSRGSRQCVRCLSIRRELKRRTGLTAMQLRALGIVALEDLDERPELLIERPKRPVWHCARCHQFVSAGATWCAPCEQRRAA